ncbi:hypothetical protein KBP30_30675 [Streptomyces sp. Go40/10]|uniref:hypothetical protein n=1 Tax=Streptomyces sp. Go40/10 TaxID=2825844 RepID=UPI001E2F160F|nr:hypothetical protein [Streptomyces sp. Go40/10]UFR05261.1 hypothetical protein KBP30_30675 [Streptomyces sp. Go40/10]
MSSSVAFRMTVSPPASDIPVAHDLGPSEDYASLVMDACELLAETDCRFRVSGFGQDAWPVDVSYDLSSVIEQLPQVRTALGRRDRARIDFYGQGVERVVGFVPAGEQVTLTCTTRTDWIPDPATGTASLADVEDMLAALAHDFRRALDRACPDVAAREPFAQW